MSLMEIRHQDFQKFIDEAQAKDFFEKKRWPEGVRCVYCKSDQISKCEVPMPYRCRKCRKHFSVRTDTVMYRSPLPLSTWLMCIRILTESKHPISLMEMSEILKISKKSVTFLVARIKSQWLQKD